MGMRFDGRRDWGAFLRVGLRGGRGGRSVGLRFFGGGEKRR